MVPGTSHNLWPPFWRSGIMHGESVLLVDPATEDPAAAALLLPPVGPIRLESATLEVQYTDQVDYIVDSTAGLLIRTPGSRIPATTREELRPSIDPDGSGFMHVRGDPSTFLFTEEGFFHRRQVSASYRFDLARWTGFAPPGAGRDLPRTFERLRAGQPLVMTIVGDSISEGYSASGFLDLAPRQPPYGDLVAAGLRDLYGSDVSLRNLAVAGWTSDDGLGVADVAGADRPDLVIVAFGMNDAGYAGAREYIANVEAIMGAIAGAAPEAEFLVVSSMLPNADWHYPQMDRFAAYRDALAARCCRGVVLADVTSLWMDLLQRKSPYDLTGNGLNHPNDFGHRLYAQALLSRLVE